MYGAGEGTFFVNYMGAAMLDSRIVYTSEMMPWIMAEILRFTDDEQVVLQIRNSVLSVFSTKEFQHRKLHEANIWDIVSHFQVGSLSDNKEGIYYFGIIVKSSSTYHHVRLFSSHNLEQVAGIMTTLTDATKSSEKSYSGLSRSSSSSKVEDECPTDSVSFEVLYKGKLRMSYRKAPASFIDDALEKFRAYESDRGSKESNESMSRRSSSAESSSNPNSDTGAVAALLKRMEEIDETDCAEQIPNKHPLLIEITNSSTIENNGEKMCKELIVPKTSFSHPLDGVTYPTNSERIRNSSGDSCLVKCLSLPPEPMRGRALSTGSEPRAQVLEATRSSSSNSNRTMILIIGKQKMRIISPDAKSTLFDKNFREISQAAKGLKNKDCFGFICKEQGPSGSIYIGYIFKCQSDSVCNDILQVLKQASSCLEANNKKERQLVCDHCPMMWFHRLCVDIEGLNGDRAREVIFRRIDNLHDSDRWNIMTKFEGAEIQSIEEQTELLMMLIRAHCESKQLTHTHDTAENRHEFLQSYLGSGAILMKAKRSFTSSFDQLMKRKEQRLGAQKFNPLLPHHVIHQGKEMSPSGSNESGVVSCKFDMIVSESPLENSNFRPRSATLSSLSSPKLKRELLIETSSSRRGSQQQAKSPLVQTNSTSEQMKHSPMMNIFLKTAPSSTANSSSPSPQIHNSPHAHSRKGSWRQAIFRRVVSPTMSPIERSHSPLSTSHANIRLGSSSNNTFSYKSSSTSSIKRSRDEIRELWRSAIRQQILLIRMEKQNYMLKAKQDEANVKRDKLSYKDLTNSSETDSFAIETMLLKDSKGELCDPYFFKAVCTAGVSKTRRGQVWQLFLRQYKMRVAIEGESGCSSYMSAPDISYEDLLRKLTSHQHSILIDLGRTFPKHKYFSGALGSGQLALFNLLKAYSLLDPAVGYCQGLSFVAALLLMHLEEEEAFEVLKYLMFEMGGREYYKPDMSGLQLKLYQLNRLIYDTEPDIHLLLFNNDVFPSLYAAPWFLTMFASQFPVGFSVRVLDLYFVQGPDVMVKFALLLIQDHKKQLMECSGLEQIMDCFKSVLTQLNSYKVDEMVHRVFELKIDRQMLIYSIEYSVMHDETFLAFIADGTSKNNNSHHHNNNKSSTPSPPANSPSSEDETNGNNNESSFKIRKIRGGVQVEEKHKEEVLLLSSYIVELEARLKYRGEVPHRPLRVNDLVEKAFE